MTVSLGRIERPKEGRIEGKNGNGQYRYSVFFLVQYTYNIHHFLFKGGL